MQVNDDSTLYRSFTVKGRASYLALVISDCFPGACYFKSYFHYRDHYQLASFCYKTEPRLIRRTNVEEVLCIMLLYWGKQGKQLICIINI